MAIHVRYNMVNHIILTSKISKILGNIKDFAKQHRTINKVFHLGFL